MRPTAKQLALRDPAMAAFVGALSGSGADFGGEFGDELDTDYGFEFGADAAIPAPTPTQAMQAWKQQNMQAMRTQQRVQKLEPNRGSAVKVERYTFNVNQTLTLGTSATISASGNPDVNIRPQRVSANVPCPGFASLSNIKVANVSVLVGGEADAYIYNPNGVGQSLDLPTLSPANRASVSGDYSGLVPPGYVGGASFKFAVSFTGWASIVA